MAIKFVLAYDHPLFLEGLVKVFQSEEDFEILANCNSGAEAIEAVRRHQPDLAVMDMWMHDMTGVQVARQIREERLDTRIVILSADLDEDKTIEALRVGVSGILLKSMSPTHIIQGLRKVHAGEQWVEHSSAMLALGKMLRRETGGRQLRGVLTPREVDIALMVTRGLHNKEIANSLCVSEGTVKVHLHNIYDKMKVNSRIALLRYAQELGVA